MDIAKYAVETDGAWLTVEVESARILEPFRFKVQPLLETNFVTASKSPDVTTRSFIEAVVGWDLTQGEGNEALPCTTENKEKYLPRFAMYLVKSLNGASPAQKTNLAAAVAEFASNPDSFLKN